MAQKNEGMDRIDAQLQQLKQAREMAERQNRIALLAAKRKEGK